MLEKLCNMYAVSGDEEEIAEFIIETVKPFVDMVETDALGNVICYIKGESDKKRVLVSAHLDEVGFIISGITDDGYLKFCSVGGIDERIMPGKSVVIGKNEIPGVIGIKPVHLMSKEERESVLKEDELVIDIGAISKEDAEKRVSLGDYATFSANYTEFGDNKILSKALDDRCGCAILTELCKKKYYYDTYICFSVQEETGTRGAIVLARKIKPDYALVIECTSCSDIGETPEFKYVTTMGEGAALSINDGGSYSDVKMTKKLYALAKEKGIPVQYKRSNAGGNDARSLQVSGGGAKCVVISIPCRYLHSPVGVISKDDYISAKKLGALFLENIKED